MDSSSGILLGRPHDRLAILWRKTIASFTTVSITEERIMGMSIGPPANSVLVMNVYLPYDDGTNRDDYAYYLGKIDSYIENSSSPSESFLETLTLT